MIHISCECVPVAARKQNLLSSIKSATKANFEAGKAYAYVHLARVYKAAKNLDSAYYYLEKASAINLDERSKRFKGYLNQTKGDYWGTKKNSQNAITYFEKAYKVWDELNVLKDKQYTTDFIRTFCPCLSAWRIYLLCVSTEKENLSNLRRKEQNHRKSIARKATIVERSASSSEE
jgi:tetratricopeptide (TPR) repeat protein